MAPAKQDDRFSWAAALIEAGPGSVMLEIGCGTGVLAERICSIYDPQLYIGVDKSASMIEKCMKRNKMLVASGKARFLHLNISSGAGMQQLAELIQSRGSRRYQAKETSLSTFDFVIAFNVNFFLDTEGKGFDNVHQLIRPTGRLCVFYQFPYQVTIKAADPLVRAITDNKFKVTRIEYGQLLPTAAVAVIAEPGNTRR